MLTDTAWQKVDCSSWQNLCAAHDGDSSCSHGPPHPGCAPTRRSQLFLKRIVSVLNIFLPLFLKKYSTKLSNIDII